MGHFWFKYFREWYQYRHYAGCLNARWGISGLNTFALGFTRHGAAISVLMPDGAFLV